LKFNTVSFKSTVGKVKVAGEGIHADGKPVHKEWTGNFDGKDYPVTGDPISDTRSYAKVDDLTLNLTVKKDGKVVDIVALSSRPMAKAAPSSLVELLQKARNSKTSRFTRSSNCHFVQ
jgi:hypothetical protein